MCVAVKSHASIYIWIVNDITDSNTCFFFLFLLFLFFSPFILFWNSMCNVCVCYNKMF